MKFGLHLPLVVALWLLAPERASAVELNGTVYTGGVPAANLTFTVEGRNERITTNSVGRYSVDLPPGKRVLLIKGRRVEVVVKNERTAHDIRL